MSSFFLPERQNPTLFLWWQVKKNMLCWKRNLPSTSWHSTRHWHPLQHMQHMYVRSRFIAMLRFFVSHRSDGWRSWSRDVVVVVVVCGGSTFRGAHATLRSRRNCRGRLGCRAGSRRPLPLRDLRTRHHLCNNYFKYMAVADVTFIVMVTSAQPVHVVRRENDSGANYNTYEANSRMTSSSVSFSSRVCAKPSAVSSSQNIHQRCR